MTPSGISQRTQWMQKYADYKQKYRDAAEAYLESIAPPAPAQNGMPHGNSETDVVAKTAERQSKAYMQRRYAKDALEAAKKKRILAMKSLNNDQKAVLQGIYFQGRSRRAVAQSLNRSDFWVRAQERTGLFKLDLPSGWESDILP